MLFTTKIWTSASNWHTYGISCRPIDLDVCKPGGAGGGAACTSDATRAVDQYMTLLIVFSTGKNGARTATYGTDETENTDNDGAFVLRPLNDSTAAGTDYYDDIMRVAPVSEVIVRMLAAGVP